MTKRFNIIDDEWIGLIGAEFVTAIEDSDSPKKTVYFVHNHNVKGVVELLNELNRLAEANEERGLAIMTYLHDNHYEVWEEVNKEVFGE